ncbi:MAG: GNAT family N-acetyltransferase [Anaerolineae bacterium]|nr:GNAT family N-acetyltransferase [Anaerolineae bacterium]
MNQQEFILREISMPEDAEKLAAMWMASNDQWPGTWSGGTEITAQWVIEFQEREKMLNTYVMETADGSAIAGYCSFHQPSDEKDVGYVGLLNVDPNYQKLSLARKMLCRCVERSVELGFKQMTLHTWPGNLKAVPLYKKVGLYWVPDTSVHMRNFIPSILTMPCARPYLDRHSWYETFQRVLDQKEDDERWEGMKVFTFRWQAGDDMLAVWVDRESQTLTAVETNDFFAAAIADNIEPAKGLPTQMRWKLTNKKSKPMLISLIANGNEHLQIEHRKALTLKPGESVEIAARVDIAADAPEVKHDKPAPAIKTLLIIDGEVIELATGLRPQPAVSVELAPKYVTLFPGVSKAVNLQLRSYLDREIEATVSLAPSPGLEVDWTERKIGVPQKNWGGAPVMLTADKSGIYELQATVIFDEGRTLPQTLTVFSLPAGGVLAGRDGKNARIENEWTRLIIEPRHGGMQIRSPKRNESLGHLHEVIGPPFWPSELEDKEYDIAVQQEQGRITATLTARLDDYPGLVLQRKVTMGAGPLIEVEYAMGNTGTETHTVQIQARSVPSHNERATITLPLKDGIVQSRRTELPAADEDISKKPEALAECWTAQTSVHGTFGVVWTPGIVENEIGWGITLLSPQLECKPQTWMPAGRQYLYAGPGDWQAVRTYARRLSGVDETPEPIPAQPRAVYSARLEPSPLVSLDDTVQAELTIDNLRARPLSGQAQLALPDGVAADRTAFEIGAVTVDAPFKEALNLTVPAQAAAHEGTLALQTQLFDTEIAVPLIRLGDRSKVVVQQGEAMWTVDNGRTRFTVAPAFSGAMTAWTEHANHGSPVNHLLSPYPEQKTFGWMSPWYGGITPLAMYGNEVPGKLGNEMFTAQMVEQTDARGIAWKGVRVSCEIKREQLVGLAVDVDYLTVGNSNVLKLVYRLRNLTTAKRGIGFGWQTYWQLDGAWEKNILRSEYVERKPTPWDSWSDVGKWGLAVNGETGRTAILVSPYPDVFLVDWGNVGGHLGFLGRMEVEPSGTAERVCYIALCASPEEAKRYIPLQDYL